MRAQAVTAFGFNGLYFFNEAWKDYSLIIIEIMDALIFTPARICSVLTFWHIRFRRKTISSLDCSGVILFCSEEEKIISQLIIFAR